MQEFRSTTATDFERKLQRARVPEGLRPEYRKWIQFYFLFCEKFGYQPGIRTSLGPFLTKLAAKNQTIEQRHQAAIAVRLFLRPEPNDSRSVPAKMAEPQLSGKSLTSAMPASLIPAGAPRTESVGVPPSNALTIGASWEQEYRDLQSAIALRNYSRKTLAAYRLWVGKFQAFASHLLLADYDLQTIQRLLGHSDIKTTMIYLQTVPRLTLKQARSPLDCAEF